MFHSSLLEPKLINATIKMSLKLSLIKRFNSLHPTSNYLTRIQEKPISEKEAKKLAKELGAVDYIEISAKDKSTYGYF